MGFVVLAVAGCDKLRIPSRGELPSVVWVEQVLTEGCLSTSEKTYYARAEEGVHL